MKIILVFDDDQKELNALVTSLNRRRLGDNIRIESFPGIKEFELDTSHEYRVNEWIRNNILNKKGSKLSLIVCDKELGKYGEGCNGLSANAVVVVAEEIGIPICVYSRIPASPGYHELLRRFSPWEKHKIVIDKLETEDIAKEAAAFFKGFDAIATWFKNQKLNNIRSPAQALASLLMATEIQDHIALYGSGEQGLLTEIIPFLNIYDEKLDVTELKHRMPRFIGNWLFTSIMRFPGILLNEIAAASYLNINPPDFLKRDIQKLFSKTKYRGPFANLGNWWWRHKLDAMIGQEDYEYGIDLVKQKKLSVRPCNDPQTGKRAGYYCMVTREPVSAENSKGGISWFPSGADLARIRKDKFHELAPWVGLY